MDTLYFRVSSRGQTRENQFEDLLEVAQTDDSDCDWSHARELLACCIVEEEVRGQVVREGRFSPRTRVRTSVGVDTARIWPTRPRLTCRKDWWTSRDSNVQAPLKACKLLILQRDKKADPRHIFGTVLPSCAGRVARRRRQRLRGGVS